MGKQRYERQRASQLMETKRPELAVSLLETLVVTVGTEDERKSAFKVQAKKLGLPETTAREIYDRFSNKYRVIVDTLRKANTVDILALLDHCIIEVMESLAGQDWSSVSARDKMVIAGIMVDKRQLLSGEPTAIVSVEDRRSLGALTKAMLAEARRRGYEVDLTPDQYNSTVTSKVALVEPAQ